MKRVHKAATGLKGASTFPASDIPIAVGTSYLDVLEGYANGSHQIAASEFLIEPHGAPGGLNSTWLPSVGEFASDEGFTSAEGLVAPARSLVLAGLWVLRGSLMAILANSPIVTDSQVSTGP